MLQLLVIRAIHIRFVRAQPRRVPAHVHDRAESATEVAAALESLAPYERVADARAAQAVDRHRVVLRLDFDAQVAVGAPPERAEDAMRAAIERELVVVADELLALDLVAIALLVRLQ